MQRFILFGGEQYYAVGGMSDFLGSFASIEDAEKASAEKNENSWDHESPPEWWQILDTETWLIVKSSEASPHGHYADDWQSDVNENIQQRNRDERH